MLLWSTKLNTAVFGVFLTLEATEIILFIGNFANNASIVKVGGYVGVLTALVAWYASAALVSIGIGGPLRLPVGPALIRAAPNRPVPKRRPVPARDAGSTDSIWRGRATSRGRAPRSVRPGLPSPGYPHGADPGTMEWCS